jgi:hypothetical protein
MKNLSSLVTNGETLNNDLKVINDLALVRHVPQHAVHLWIMLLRNRDKIK